MNIPERIETLRRISRGKTLTLEKHRKDRDAGWIETYTTEARVLDWAARYIETKEGLNT